jgi:predicted YcjX-like family ATPase
LLEELVEALFHEEAVVRARAADALEKVSRKQPAWLRPYRGQLLGRIAAIDQKEVRWHVAQMLARLALTPKQRDKAVKLLREYLANSDSQIVKVSALQALADLAAADPSLRTQVSRLIEAALRHGSPALKARAKRLRTR